MPMPHRARTGAALMLVLAIAGCADPHVPGAPVEPLGDFRLGHNIVLANNVEKGPFSRDATPEELSAALGKAIEDRLLAYDGDGLYHLGVGIGAYVLAAPGVPVVYTPKSILIFDVTVYDNATGRKLNEEPYRITAFEGLQNTAPIIGSGIARSKAEQLENLSKEGARLLQNWLIENADWFTPKPGTERVEYDREAERQKIDEALAGGS